MTTQARPSEALKRRIEALERGEWPPPGEPEQTLPGQPKGR